MKILHIISSLNDGGAEGVLYRLIVSTKKIFNHEVICLLNEGKYGKLLEKHNIKVSYLNMSRDNLNISKILKLYSIIKLSSPDTVQTWMYHADLIGGMLAKILRIKNIFWNIRSSHYYFGKTKLRTVILIYLCGIFSWLIPTSIICNSKISIKIHRRYLYKNNFTLIYNGVDTEIYKPNYNNRFKIRKKLNIEKNVFLVGCVARFDPQKDHLNLIKAINFIKKYDFNLKLVLIGKGIKNLNKECNKFIRENKLNKKIILLENQNNINEFYNSFDLFILPSLYGEAFPNVIAEAMSSKLICISTDVGDSKFIISNNNFIIPTNNPSLMCDKIIEIYKLYKNNLKQFEYLTKKNRDYVIDNFNLQTMCKNYSNIWLNKRNYT